MSHSLSLSSAVTSSSSSSSTTSSSANMYRVGDYVYFETTSTSPFQVRRIEELNKTPTGNVEAKVMCFFRRRDLPQSLTFLADRHQSALEEEGLSLGMGLGGMTASGKDSFSPKERHLLQHRELFLSRQVETLPATLIRGKCSVTLLNETESLDSYLSKDDTFFYSLVYDPQQKTLLADKGEIRVGSRYQAETPKSTLGFDIGETDGRELSSLETLVWTPSHGLTDKQIDQFLVLSRSVGTFARALDCSSSVKQPSLHMSAAAASRDVTLFHAMNTLHKSNYDVSRAVSSLVPSSGPLLCRDELEEWSASEANLFEEALDKYGKDFHDIRSDYLPWKTGKNLVEYYYMWKTTDRYVQQKRVKAAEAETKLKQVYIPNYNKLNSGSGSGMQIGGSKGGQALNGSSIPTTPTNERDQPLISGKPCESCLQTSSTQWYAWTGSSGIQARLCNTCWHYWRKYGGLKIPNKMLDGVEMEVKKVGLPVPGTTGFGIGMGIGMGIGPSSQTIQSSGPKSEPSLSDNDGEGTGGSTVVLVPGAQGSTERQTIQLPPGLIQQRFHRCAVQGCGKDFKMKNQLARHYATNHGLPMRQTSSPRPVMKTRTAFYLHTTPMTRVARRLCSSTTLKPRHASRSPFWPINSALIKQECQQGVINKSPEDLKRLVTNRKRKLVNPKVADVSYRLGQLDRSIPGWLVLTEKSKIPKPIKEAWPKPPKGPDGSLIYERVPEKFFAPLIPPFNLGSGESILGSTGPTKKRAFDEINGMEVPVPSKRDRGHHHHQHTTTSSSAMGGPNWDTSSSLLPRELGGSGSSGNQSLGLLPGSAGGRSPTQQIPILPTSSLPAPVRNLVNHVNGAKAKIATVTRVGSRKQIISWMDAPDDLYFSLNEQSKKLRRTLTPSELRRLARSPCKKSILKGEILPIIPPPSSVTTATPIPSLIIPHRQPPMPIPHTALSVANLTSSSSATLSPGSGGGSTWPRESQGQ